MSLVWPYIDSLAGKKIQTTLQGTLPIDIPNISEYPDFLAFGIILLLTVTLCFGVQFSSRFNSVFTVINLAVVIFAVIAGSIKSDVKNWSISKEEASKHELGGEGGFMPNGVSGMMKGASTCFYAFVGFDVIATTGEETKNPQRSIPIGIVVSLFVVFLAYFSVSTVETMMSPYYLQDNSAPLAHVFEEVGWPAAKIAISVGALAGLSTSLLCSMFPLPRILYAMASDGLIFRWFARVNQRFQTPILATVLSGLFSGVMAMLFDVSELADMMSIGTFLAYTLVAVSVIILRYKFSDPVCSPSSTVLSENGFSANGNSHVSLIGEEIANKGTNGNLATVASPRHRTSGTTWKEILLQLFNFQKLNQPTELSSKTSIFLVVLISLLIIILDVLLVFTEDSLAEGKLWAVIPTCIVFLFWLLSLTALWMQPSSPAKLTFKVPLVPFVPFLSATVNVYLMLQLPVLTWIRFAVWMAVGFSIYFFYGIWNSNLRHARTEAVHLETQDNKAFENKDEIQDSPVKIPADITVKTD